MPIHPYKIVLPIVFCLFSLTISYAALNFDSNSDSGAGISGSMTWSHTTSGINRIILVGVGRDADSIKTVTYAGTAMTSFKTISNINGKLDCFFLINPAEGTNNVVVTFNTPIADSKQWGAAISMNGAWQSLQPEVSSITANTSTVASSTVTTTVDQDVTVDFGWGSSSFSWTVGANQTSRINKGDVTTAQHIAASNSTNPISPAGSFNDFWTLSASKPWFLCVAAIRQGPNIGGDLGMIRGGDRS